MRQLAAVLLSAVLGILVMVGVQALEAPRCPTEDSCRISYEHGKWSVREVTP